MTEFFVQTADWWIGTATGGGMVLLAGCVLMRFTRQPAARQRIGEYAVFAALIVAGLRLMPAWLPAPFFLPSPGFAGEGSGVRAVDSEPSPPTPLPQSRERGDVYVFVEAEDTASADAAPGAAPSSVWTWRYVTAYAVAAYLLVAAALASRWLLGQWALGRLLRQARPAAPRVRRLFTAMAAGAIWPLPQLRLSRRLRAPICFGLRRPAVLLPEPMDDAADNHLRWVFAHELTHLQRRDPWSSWGLGLAQAVYFFLPWFWWVKRQVRLCQEYVADAAAANAGAAADEYAEFLVNLARGSAPPLGATGLGSSSDLLRRVQMLLQPSSRVQGNWPRGRLLLAAGGLLAVAIFAGGVGLRADEPQEEQKTEVQKKVIVINSDDAVKDKKGDENVHVIVKVVEDDDKKKDDKDAKPGEKKAEKPSVRAIMVIDSGNGPVTIPLDGTGGEDLGKQIEKAVKKAREQAETGKKQQDKATEKALDLLKGELSDEQLKQLQRHIEALRAQKRAVEAQHERAEKAVAAAKAARDARQRATDEKVLAEDKHQQIIQELMKAGVMSQSGDKLMKVQPHVVAFVGGRLGTQVKKPSADLADQLDLPKDQGLVVVEVVKDSAAAKAGLKSNDIILEIAGKPIPSDPATFAAIVHELKAKDEVAVIVLRKGHREKVNVNLPEPKKDGQKMIIHDAKPEEGIKIEGGNLEFTIPEVKDFPKFEWKVVPQVAFGVGTGKASDDKKEEHKNRSVSVNVSNGKFTAEQKEDDVTITVSGTIDDGKVGVEKITVNDDGNKKSYKRVADVPEKHRDSVKKLISNTNQSPVRFNSINKREEK